MGYVITPIENIIKPRKKYEDKERAAGPDGGWRTFKYLTND